MNILQVATTFPNTQHLFSTFMHWYVESSFEATLKHISTMCPSKSNLVKIPHNILYTYTVFHLH